MYGIRRVVREILSIISTSISATLMSMPVLAYYFGRVPLIGIFTNILILNAVGVILVLGSIGAVIGGLTFAHGLAPAIFNVSNWIIDYVVSCVRTFAKFRFASVEMYFSDLVIIFGIAVVIFAILMLFTKRMSSKAMTACAGTIAALIYVFASTIMFEGTAEIRVFDAGNSTCVLLTYDGEAVMIGCGFEYDTYDKVSSVLSDKGVDGISLLVLPTYRDSECSGIVELLRNIPVDTIASGSDNIMYRKHGVKYISGDKIKFEILDGCTLMADFEDGNALTGLRIETWMCL